MRDMSDGIQNLLHAPVDSSLLEDLCRQLYDRLEDRLQQIVLFGSYARGSANSESDLDVLVLVEDDGQSALDLARIARYEVMRKRGFKPLISMLLLGVEEWQDMSRHSAGLKHNIEREGITIWPMT